jgi:rhomboid protease GluP
LDWEEKYKSSWILLMMLITALVTAALHMFLFPQLLLGASGIVFMFIILVSFVNMKKGSIPLTFLIVLVLFISKEIYQSFQQDNISQFAHIIGGICGSVFGFTVRPGKSSGIEAKDLLD